MDKTILELDQVSRRFGERFALENISLDLRPGEVHILTGENGSGKSVLMKIIAGHYSPDSGSLNFEGKPVAFSSLAEARASGIVYQHQDIELFDNLSIAENVWFIQPKKTLGFTPPDHFLNQRCQVLFNRFGIDLSPTTMVSKLGYAQKLLVAACATYITKGKVIIFDEPTAGMGENERVIFYRIIRSLQAKGTGIFYISHRLEEIPEIGNRLTVMQQGRITGHLDSVSADRNAIIRMMIGTNCPERYPRIANKAGPVTLSVRHLASKPALQDINFQLSRGEILGLAGLMGSGRTRLANCLFGVISPDGGEILVDNQVVAFSHPAEALRRGIAMIPEDRSKEAVFFRQNVFSNLVAAALQRFNSATGLDTRYMEELSQQYLHNFGINPAYLHGLISLFSGGNQQKIVIARWLMSLSRIFIMDEPTRGIDAAARVDIYNAMNDLVGNGASIILISSDPEELLGMCDRIMILAGGRITHFLDRKSATKEQILDLSSAF